MIATLMLQSWECSSKNSFCVGNRCVFVKEIYIIMNKYQLALYLTFAKFLSHKLRPVSINKYLIAQMNLLKRYLLF
jgi:hypothetical protein